MTRNASFDYARLLAVFGIVLFHSGAPGAAWGYVGLPFFLLLLGVFAAPAAARLSTAAYARTRARRLLTPWLIWSAIYAALLAVQAARNGRPVLADFDASMLLTGPALHLWFLPFAFVAGCALHALARGRGAARAGLDWGKHRFCGAWGVGGGPLAGPPGAVDLCHSISGAGALVVH